MYGSDFVDVTKMFAGPMLMGPDVRRNHGEPRLIGFGFIRGRLIAVGFSERDSGPIRIILVRKANRPEKAHDQKRSRLNGGRIDSIQDRRSISLISRSKAKHASSALSFGFLNPKLQ